MTLDEVLLGVKNQSNIDISCSHFIIIVLVYYVFLGYSIHSMNFMVFLSCLANFPRITLQQQIIQTLSGYFINKLHQSSVHLIIVCLLFIHSSALISFYSYFIQPNFSLMKFTSLIFGSFFLCGIN